MDDEISMVHGKHGKEKKSV